MRIFLFLFTAGIVTAANRIPSYQWTRWFHDPLSLTVAAPAPDGGVYIGGRLSLASSPTSGYLTRLSATGETRWTLRLDEVQGMSLNHEVLGGTVDRSGNFWVVGRMVRSAAIGGIWSVGFIAGFTPEGRLIRTHVLGRDTVAQGIAIDAAANAWVSGTVKGMLTSFGAPTYGFVSRVTPAGEEKRMLQIGGDKTVCSGGSGCIAAWVSTSLPQIVIGPGGIVAVAGSTSSVGMKISPNAIPTSVGGGGVLAILDSDGVPLLETYLGGSPRYIGSVSCGSAVVHGIAFDAEGMLYAGGTNGGVRPTTTSGVVQPDASIATSRCGSDPANEIGFLYRIDPRLGKALFSTMLGGESGSVRGLYVDGAAAWVGGTAGSSFPVTAGEFSRGSGMLANVTSDGRYIAQSTKLPGGLEGRPVKGENGTTYILSEHAISAFGPMQGASPILYGAANAAGRPITEWIVPGEVISLYGSAIGPAEPAHVLLDHEGRIETNLRGVRLFLDGKAFPLLYADSQQINAIVPFGDYGPQANMELVHDDRVVLRRAVRMEKADPAFLASCWDIEGKLNTPENPASARALLACWISGMGDLSPRPPDGALPSESLGFPVQTVTAVSSTGTTRPLEVLFLGQAPLAPAGIVQINFRAPRFEGSVSMIQVTAAGRTASTLIYLRAPTTL